MYSSDAYLSEHEVGVLVRIEFNIKHSAVFTLNGDDGFFVLNLISVHQPQSSDLLCQLVVLSNLQCIYLCRQKR